MRWLNSEFAPKAHALTQHVLRAIALGSHISLLYPSPLFCTQGGSAIRILSMHPFLTVLPHVSIKPNNIISLHENKGELSFTFILDSLFHLTTILVSFLSFSRLRPILQTPCYSFVTLFNLVRVTVTLHYHYFYFVALILTSTVAGFTTLCPTTNYTSPPPILSHNRL